MQPINRRGFIGATALGALAVSTLQIKADEPRKIKLGLIGAGWYGMVDVEAAFKAGGVEVLAVCDVDSAHLNEAAQKIEKLQGSRPKTFKNHRELLDVAGLEAVIIATPPHWHALQFLDVIAKGLDVYCEKPLAYDVGKGRRWLRPRLHIRNASFRSVFRGVKALLSNKLKSIFRTAMPEKSSRPMFRFIIRRK